MRWIVAAVLSLALADVAPARGQAGQTAPAPAREPASEAARKPAREPAPEPARLPARPPALEQAKRQPQGGAAPGAGASSYYEMQKKLGVKNVPGEKIAFDSTTPLTVEALFDRTGAPARVAGYLQMPDKPKGRVPAVIVFNCGDTIKAFKELAYAGELLKQGYAVFIVDSFAGRDGSGEPAAFFRLRHAAAADALNALKLLSADPRIDARRVAILGWANGGAAILSAAGEELRALYAGGNARFAAMIPIQAWCGVATVAQSYPATPILLLHGAKDDFLPPEHCARFARAAAAAGARIETTVYPEAAHNWDAPAPMKFHPDYPTVKDCMAMSDMGARSIALGNGEAVKFDDPAAMAAVARHFGACRGMGHTSGQVGAVRARALGDVKAFLKKSFAAAG